MLFSRENQARLQARDYLNAISSHTGCKGFGSRAVGPRKIQRERAMMKASSSAKPRCDLRTVGFSAMRREEVML
jgi:hypothetical protein